LRLYVSLVPPFNDTLPPGSVIDIRRFVKEIDNGDFFGGKPAHISRIDQILPASGEIKLRNYSI
jgi:hypothetical protein